MTKNQKSLTILHLYPNEMNLYGDHGNVLTLQKRCKWRGIKTQTINYEPGQTFPKNADIIFGGGGQDSGQIRVAKDILRIAPELRQLILGGTPCLAVCGLYQLFGNTYIPYNGEPIEGAGILSIESIGSPERMIGNIIIDSPEFGRLVGYENHSGKTYLKDGLQHLGNVIKGAGNNGEDGGEGARFKNCIGTYLHGPILPKNPQLADFIISTALANKYGETKLQKLDDSLEAKTHKTSAARPR